MNESRGKVCYRESKVRETAYKTKGLQLRDTEVRLYNRKFWQKKNIRSLTEIKKGERRKIEKRKRRKSKKGKKKRTKKGKKKNEKIFFFCFV